MALEELGARPAATAGEDHAPIAEAELLFQDTARLSTSRSIAWSLGGQLGTTLLSVGSTVVLARILTPADFGAFAFATTIYALVQWLMQLGLGNYILREAALTRAKLNAAFAVALGQGLTALLIVAASAPVAGAFSRSATVGWVTLAVAATPFLTAPEGVSDALWLRGGRYAAIAWLQMAKMTMQTAVSLAAQLMFHWGVYALAAGLIANAGTSFVVSLTSLLVRQRARPVADAAHFREVRTFGGRSLVLTLAQAASLSLPNLLVGRLLSIPVLGHYSRAQNAIDTIGRTFSASVMRATAPRFYAKVNTGAPLPQGVGELCEVLLFFVWPASAGMAALSGPVIRLMYGPQWGIAAQALPLLCLAFAIDAARTGGMETMLIRDRLGFNARLEFVRAVYAVGLVVLLARFGLIAVLWGRNVEAVATVALYLLAMRRIGGVPLRLWPRLYAVNALLAGAAALPAVLLMRHWGWPPQLSAARFAAAIGGGLALWLATLIATGHPYVAVGHEMLRRLGRSPRAHPIALTGAD